MSSFDVFNSTPFALRQMTAAIQAMPFVPARIGEMNLFTPKPMATVTAQIEVRNNQLYLVKNTPRGAPAEQNERNLRDMHPLNATHLPIEDRITPDEIQDVRAFGSESQLEGVAMVVADRLGTMRQSLEATTEHLRIGAIKGVVNDSDGVTPIYDLYSVFGVTKEADVNFDLDNASPADGAVRKQCSAVIRTIEDNLGSIPYTGIHGFCGSAFFDDLTAHPETRTAYERWNDGQMLRDRMARRTFAFGGIMFEEYRGVVDGVQYVDDDECHFFPTGSPGLFDVAFAPGNFIGAANMLAEEVYARSVIDPADRWVDLYAQSNPLPYCTRPKVLMTGLRT